MFLCYLSFFVGETAKSIASKVLIDEVMRQPNPHGIRSMEEVEMRRPNPLSSSRCKEHATSYRSSCLVTNDHDQMASCKRRKGAVDLLFQGLKVCALERT